MQASTWFAVVAMGLGLGLVLRAAFVVTTDGQGRFRADPWVTGLLGFALILIGQYLFPP